MGKKSKSNKSQGTAPPSSTNVPEPMSTSAVAPAVYYPSDGPSDIELLQTTSISLQAKLDQLTQLGLANDRASFVQQFVPLELSSEDMNGYLQDLTTHPEAEGTWTNLISEIAAIRGGKGVDRIEGDQVTKAVFYFTHPLLHMCDREVAFCCVNGEWRADG
jgi:hypothetical protein